MRNSTDKKEILVNVGHLEARVAIMENGKLAELHVEREPKIVGNIYKARVATVLPGMEAAFVDVGIEKHAFLCAEDSVYTVQKQGGRETIVMRPLENKPLGGITVNQEILVQVNRAAVGSKGARVSTRLALPGRYLVLLLTDPGRVGVSRKVEVDSTRLKLRKLGEEVCPADSGIIMRTEAEGTRRPQLRQDLDFLLELKRRLLEKAAATPAPALVHQDLTLVFQVIRDYFTKDIDRLLIDSEEIYHSAVELVGELAPRLKSRVELYRDEIPIFERFGIEEEVARLWQRKVWLKAGGYISIDQTEALCAVDVNTARYTGKAKTGLSETILRTNLEAAEEIARQLRLRDLGGLIVVDFIDMKSPAHRARVLKTFQDAIEHDRAKTRVLSISPLGMVEMTRKKHGESLLEKASEPCPECAALGRVPNTISMCLQLEHDLRLKAKEKAYLPIAVHTTPELAYTMVGAGGTHAAQLSQALHRPIYVRTRPGHPRGYEIEFLEGSEIAERVGSFEVGQQLTCHRLSEDGDVAVSEEGYLVELQPPAKTKDESFTVELTRMTPYIGAGYLPSEKVEEVAQPTVSGLRTRGIMRRGFRARMKKEAAAPGQLVPPALVAEPVILPPPPPAMPVVEAAPPVVEQPKPARRRRHRSKKSHEPHPETAAAETKLEAPAPEPVVVEQPVVLMASEPAAEPPSKPKRRYRPRKKKETPPAEGAAPGSPAA